MHPAPSDIVLRDGSTVHVRPTEPADAAPLGAFFAALTPDERWLRFMGVANLRRTAQQLVDETFGLVATAGHDGAIVAHACLGTNGDRSAEVAFAVADEWQGRGIATTLLAHLTQAAQERGVRTLHAIVHPSNHRMLEVLREAGVPLEVRSGSGVLVVEMPTRFDAQARRRFEERAREATVAAVAHVLRPSSVAVIGASRRRTSVGGAVAHNLVTAGFAGPVYPINPHARTIAGRRAYASLADVPGPVELAIVAVAAPGVIDAAQACAAAGVRALVVLSAGFGETGARGRERQQRLLRVCREAGMRLVGPNCLGVLNTGADVRLNATFAPDAPPSGRVAFASQSGAFGIAALAQAAERGLGLSSFVSMGDKADLSGNDFLQFWEGDADTDVVLLYLESLGNPRRFAQIVRRVTARKPVIAVKSGRTPAGRRAASSHTGALLQASEVTVDALFAHAGVIRTDTLSEQLDVAAVLAQAPLPPGDRVAIVTNVGGPAIACADACVAAGLRVERLGNRTRRTLAAALPSAAASENPVDMLATATAVDFRRAVEVVAADPAVDAIVAIFLPPLPGRTAAPVLRALGAARRTTDRAGKPLIAVIMDPGATGAPARLPVFATPEEAARALGHVARQARRVRRPPVALVPPPGVDRDAASALIADALAHGDGWLDPLATDRLLRAYGIPTVATYAAHTASEASRLAAQLGGPVALKAVAPGLVHKTDAGAVRLGLGTPTAARRAAADLRATLASAGRRVESFVVQPMAPPGVEMLIGLVGDPSFGPIVACGAGGTSAELLGDVRVRLAPLDAGDAAAMVRDLRTFPLLEGYRGSPRADVSALEDVVERVGALGAAHPEIAELDLNPVIVSPSGAVAVDARVRIEAAPRRPPFPAIGA